MLIRAKQYFRAKLLHLNIIPSFLIIYASINKKGPQIFSFLKYIKEY